MVAKSSRAYRTIGEVASDLGLPAHVLRFWESKFDDFIEPMKCNGRRLYDEKAIEVLSEIQSLLHEQGMTIKGAQRYLTNKEANSTQKTIIEQNTQSVHKNIPEDSSSTSLLSITQDDLKKLALIYDQLSHIKLELIKTSLNAEKFSEQFEEM